MRIALVTEAFHPALDPDTATVRELADQLIAAGHRLLLLTAAPGLSSYRGARVTRIRVGDLGGSLVASAQIADEIEAFEPDLVQVHSPGSVGLRALAVAAEHGVPTLVVQSQRPRSLPAWRRATASATRVLATSRWLARELGGVDALWRPGFDVDAFAPRLRSDWLHDHWALPRYAAAPLTVVGYAGELQRDHGVRRLAELGAVPGTRVVTTGVGPDRSWLARRLPGAKLCGPMSRGELAVALASLDVVVETAPGRTSGELVRAAAASGVPVVSLRGAGAEELVEHGQTGMLYDDRPGALAAAVASLAHDAAGRAVLGFQARAAAETHDWAVAAAGLVAEQRAAVRREPGAARDGILTR